MTTVLVVEDNRDLAFGLKTALQIEGYDVNVAYDGRAVPAEVTAPRFIDPGERAQ